MDEKKFKIQRVSGQPVTNDELILDLQRMAARTGKNTIGIKEYRRMGQYHDTTVSRRFGTWNRALKAAGLDIANEINLTDNKLFENIFELWDHYGRQPRKRELALPPSRISEGPYLRRFGSWTKALQKFIEFANSNEGDANISDSAMRLSEGKNTPRDPSLRLRFRVLQRDSFTCQSCGASPAKQVGVALHVDHIIPWSKGGETTFENLQTLCSRCNLGKGNLGEEP
jgi:hypothetical protein